MAQQSRVGELLAGKYRLDALLGSGGVGDVYRAQNTLIGRTVAIKVLRAEHVTDDNVVERFLREAKAANLARHPNVVDVLDVGLDEEGIPFIVQEFLQGFDLGEYLKRSSGPLPHRQVLDLLIPVVEAVGFAHVQGVVHRDLKPENVFLAKTDQGVVPKLLDFGISYIKPQPGDVRMTKTGITVGTPAYMSPEQLEGTGGVDARTDVWALGVILYEALSGRLPFEGETSALLFAQIAWVDPIPLSEVAPRVPERLLRVVGRCLRRTVKERYPSAAELARDLVHVREGRPIEVTHQRPAPIHRSGTTPTGVPASRRELAPPSSKPDIVPIAISVESEEVANASNGSRISLATLPPPPIVEPQASVPPDAGLMEAAPRLLAFIGTALLSSALWMTIVHQPDGWPAHEWLMRLVGGLQTPGALFLALVGGGGSIWFVLWLSRTHPRPWGAVVVALGLAMIVLPVGLGLLGATTDFTTAPTLWGWGMVTVTIGLALIGTQRAWALWDGEDLSGKLIGSVLIAGATIVVLFGFEVFRAVLT